MKFINIIRFYIGKFISIIIRFIGFLEFKKVFELKLNFRKIEKTWKILSVKINQIIMEIGIINKLLMIHND